MLYAAKEAFLNVFGGASFVVEKIVRRFCAISCEWGAKGARGDKRQEYYSYRNVRYQVQYRDWSAVGFLSGRSDSDLGRPDQLPFTIQNCTAHRNTE